MKRRVSPVILALIVPLALCTVLNAVVRPWLADRLGGTPALSGAGVRGPDRWWIFDDATRQDHPVLTAFLTLSDGVLGMLTFAVIALLLIVIHLSRRLRRAGR